MMTFHSNTLLLVAALAPAGAMRCPDTATQVDTFSAEGTVWTACEDLSTQGGAIVLVPRSGEAIWLPKTYEPYSQGSDEEYYLGLGKQTVLGAKWDMLGDAVLTQ